MRDIAQGFGEYLHTEHGIIHCSWTLWMTPHASIYPHLPVRLDLIELQSDDLELPTQDLVSGDQLS